MGRMQDEVEKWPDKRKRDWIGGIGREVIWVFATFLLSECVGVCKHIWSSFVIVCSSWLCTVTPVSAIQQFINSLVVNLWIETIVGGDSRSLWLPSGHYSTPDTQTSHSLILQSLWESSLTGWKWEQYTPSYNGLAQFHLLPSISKCVSVWMNLRHKSC